MKYSNDPVGNRPPPNPTFQLVAQRLNQLLHNVPRETAMTTCTLPEQIISSDSWNSWHIHPRLSCNNVFRSEKKIQKKMSSLSPWRNIYSLRPTSIVRFMNRQYYRQGKGLHFPLNVRPPGTPKGVLDDLKRSNILRNSILLLHCVTNLFKHRIKN